MENARKFADPRKFEELDDAESIRLKFPVLTGPMKGWRGIMNGDEGWVSPKDVLVFLAQECQRGGVTFISGPKGDVERIHIEGNIVKGAYTKDGTLHRAPIVVLAAGAWSETLLDFEKQLEACAYGVCQIQLTQEEIPSLSGFPVVFTEHCGDWFPPNEEGIMKGCAFQQNSFTNLTWCPQRGRNISVPRDKAFHPTDTLPIEHQQATREFLQTCLPQLSERPFIMTKVEFSFLNGILNIDAVLTIDVLGKLFQKPFP